MTCPSCDHTQASLWTRCHDRLRNVSLSNHAYYTCQKCKLVYLHPLTTNKHYAEFYDSAYISHQSPIYNQTISSKASVAALWRTQIWQYILDVPMGLPRRISVINKVWLFCLSKTRLFRHTPLKAYGCGHRILDVGCGAGSFLFLLKSLGWKTSGLEPSTAMVKNGYKFDLHIKQGINIADHWEQPTFDAVVLNQVFEHLEDPDTTLKEIYNATKENGILVMNFPNIQSVAAQLFRSYWFNLDAPRHNLFPSKKTLTNLLKQTGWEPHLIYTASSTKGWTGSIEYILRDAIDLPIKQGSVRSCRWLNLAFIPIVRVLDWTHLGDNLYVIAKKTSL
ncbi:class I SAM-dependent methyltransferase [Candidatus Uhrbacteria bacterium]|nr:class I SAM-dependent methyltransferase [Candidatus Uhrbacteria bacterium]